MGKYQAQIHKNTQKKTFFIQKVMFFIVFYAIYFQQNYRWQWIPQHFYFNPSSIYWSEASPRSYARDLSPSEPLALDDSKKQLPASPRAPKIRKILRPLPRKAKTLTFSPSGNWRVFVNPIAPFAHKNYMSSRKGRRWRYRATSPPMYEFPNL